MCYKRMPRNLNIKIYETAVKPVLLYGPETWTLRRSEHDRMERTEIRQKLRIEEIRRRAEAMKKSKNI